MKEEKLNFAYDNVLPVTAAKVLIAFNSAQSSDKNSNLKDSQIL